MLENILEMIFYTGIFYGIIGTVMVGLLIIVIQHLIEGRGSDGKSREECKKEHKNPKGNTRRIRRDSGK